MAEKEDLAERMSEPIKINKASDTYCAAFWMHTNLRTNKKIFPCCRFKTEISEFDGDLSKVLHSRPYTELRAMSQIGQPIRGCSKCYDEERKGRFSHRQWFNKTFDPVDVELQWVELGLDNQCNLTCDGCSEEFSSAWAHKKFPLQAKKLNVNIQEVTEIPDTVNHISFLGGEPLMNNRHKKILKMVTDKKHTNISYNTNGTFLLDQESIDLLKQFDRVTFVISIDGYGTLNDTVRSGSKWNDIIKFIDQISNEKFVKQIHTVLHKNNWHGLVDLHEFIVQQNIPWTINCLTYPKELDIAYLDDQHKQNLIDLLDLCQAFPEKQYVINHLNQLS